MSAAAEHWPASSVESRPLSAIKLDPANARRHPPQQVALLANLQLRYGFTQPVLLDENNLCLAGEGRILAADQNVQRGYERFRNVPAVIARGWSVAQKRAYAIADNQVALSSEWDESLLTEQLKGLSGQGEDLRGLSFTDAELGRLNVSNDALTGRVNDATGFLSDIKEPDPDAGQSEAAPDATGYVALSFTLLPAERAVIMKALKAELARAGLKTIAAALHAICKRLTDEADREPAAR